MIPDDEPFKYRPIEPTMPHTDEFVEWLEALEPRPFGIEW